MTPVRGANQSKKQGAAPRGMILITGGLGFIGSHVAAALLDAGESVVLLQRKANRAASFLSGELGKRLFVVAADLADAEALQGTVKKYGIDGIVHLAAPPLAVETIGLEFQSNLNGLTAVLETARACAIKRVTMASSIAVYRGLARGPFVEAASLPVGATFGVEAFKKVFETLGDYYALRTGLDVVCLRISSVYGPLYRSLTNMPSRIVHAAIRGVMGPLPHGSSPRTYADAAGDFLYVKDCALGICRVQLAPRLGSRIYNLGAGYATSASTLCAAVQRLIPNAEFSFDPGSGPGERADAFEDISLLAAETGFVPRYTVDNAIAEYVEWLRSGNPF